MKRILLFFAITCSVLSAKAQFGAGAPGITGKISGTVVDSLTKKPLEYATISIFRSGGKAPITGVITDDKGNYKFNNLAPGKYKISLSFIGYPAKIVDPVITTPSKPDHNMGTILLAPSTKALTQVNVVGQRAVIENKVDKIVYNAEKDLTAVGGNASDILRKVPLVSVDINGNVSLRGDQNVKVLINGKPSGAMANNLADVLRSFPADQIKSVEVVTSPSAKYDAEGSGGIINIITKSSNISGVSGSVSGGVGTRQNNGNASLSVKQNRLSLTGNFGGNFTWPQETPTTFNSVNDTSVTDQNSLSRIKRYSYTGSGSLSYDFNNFNSITSDIRFNQGGFKNTGHTSTSNTSPSFSNLYSTDNNTKTVFGGFDWNAGYTHKFKKEGSELSINGQWSHSTTTVDYTTLYSADSPYFIPTPSQQANNGGVNNEYTAQVDYALPINNAIKFEAGGKSIFRIISSNSDFYKQAGTGDFTFDPTASNNYDYDQDVYAGYSVFTFTLPKGFALQTGGRIENTQIDGKSSNANLGLEPFSNSYTTFVPSLSVSKTTGAQTFKLSYTKRIQRPSLQFLNPFINQSNLQNQSQGNPNLSPEVSQSVELNYNTYIKSSVINASVYYKKTSDVIESLVNSYRIANPVAGGDSILTNRTTYANVGTNSSVGVSLFGSVNPIQILTIRGNVNAFTYKPNASSQFSDQQSSNGTYIQYNAFMSGSLVLKGGFTAETYAILNSPRRTIQGKNPSFGFIGFGMKKDILQKKATIGFNTLSPFQNAINFDQQITGKNLVQTSHTAFPFRSFGLTFSYNFGKISVKPENPLNQKKGLNDDLKTDPNNQGGGGQGGAPQMGGR